MPIFQKNSIILIAIQARILLHLMKFMQSKRIPLGLIYYHTLKD